ncbi:hypothetical protein RBH20_09170 [Haloarcula sp. H-GB4]|uniref:hypothetical protein n=1 Tax=Haloarcula sp. H-GB4 TaxID=3069755 RepID=UPI0027ADF516|nr:hypothetical protein [Haloarcula sp. H-GB4]MDQ2072704.1 hypothetical protein [Haloarcula sp. H-GB4]
MSEFSDDRRQKEKCTDQSTESDHFDLEASVIDTEDPCVVKEGETATEKISIRSYRRHRVIGTIASESLNEGLIIENEAASLEEDVTLAQSKHGLLRDTTLDLDISLGDTELEEETVETVLTCYEPTLKDRCDSPTATLQVDLIHET